MNNTIYNNFSASKMSIEKSKNTRIEFTDFLGRKHSVAIKGPKQLKEVSSFFGELKRESVAINKVLAEYPMVLGKVPVKFHSQVRKELAELKLSASAMNIVLMA